MIKHEMAPSVGPSPPMRGLVARYTSKEEWLSQNETKLSDLWESLRNYLGHTNSFFFDKCDYVTFCDFVASHSTHFDDE